MTFIANWICRSDTVVLVKTPAVPPRVGESDVPVASKMSVLKSRWDWLGEVGAIESIKYVYAELYVEILRDSLDLVILEYREIQICDARAIQDIATCIASQVEAFAVAE